ncbi:hypothetical protein D8674_024640 [Pyrus ussuriensis x Pyrus communis]|uniref:Uncharacterized protein n=1 Tax=Pyrus ussuriensis x Pyrus communis TaxID=2448454 RepID=A0A5N5H4H3_9ROSA|nr:hypothetical protein D8674_024640 [Pyrus ussuriensis x Pyrus communis]
METHNLLGGGGSRGLNLDSFQTHIADCFLHLSSSSYDRLSLPWLLRPPRLLCIHQEFKTLLLLSSTKTHIPPLIDTFPTLSTLPVNLPHLPYWAHHNFDLYSFVPNSICPIAPSAIPASSPSIVASSPSTNPSSMPFATTLSRDPSLRICQINLSSSLTPDLMDRISSNIFFPFLQTLFIIVCMTHFLAFR